MIVVRNDTEVRRGVRHGDEVGARIYIVCTQDFGRMKCGHFGESKYIHAIINILMVVACVDWVSIANNIDRRMYW